MSEQTPQQANEARQVAEANLATATALAETASFENALRLIESPNPVAVPWQEYPGYESFDTNGLNMPFIWSEVDDRTAGQYLPLYRTEQDLKRIRATARTFKGTFPVAEGAVTTLTNYVVGQGYGFKMQPTRDGAEEVARQANAILDTFMDHNNFVGAMDREIHENTREDGEAFVTLYRDGDQVRIELTAPEFICEPAHTRPLEDMLNTSHKLNAWHHGVHTIYHDQLKRDDVTRPLGYHACYDREGDQWDYLPAGRVEHIKRNVGRRGRRGVSDYFILQNDLEREAKIRGNTAEGAAILAAIVMIREHAPGVSKSSITSMVQGNSTSNYAKGIEGGQRTTYNEAIKPGTTKDIPSGMKHTIGPLGQLRSPIYIEVAGYVLRIIGSRWSMPEYMISGDASNSNYASTLVSESPFVKEREHDQAFYGRHFESLIWKAMRMYHTMGAFGQITWPQLRAAIKLKMDPPEVASRDEAAQAAVNEILNRNGIKSKQTWATETGLDYDEERAEIEREPIVDATGEGVPVDAAPVATPAPEPVAPKADEPKEADLILNGAQIQAASGIVAAVAAGELPRDAGISQLEFMFRLSHDQATEVMGSSGTAAPTIANPKTNAPADVTSAIESIREGMTPKQILDRLYP